ncbi:MAG TPA: LLM class flavin-dependent oxidoreductase [Candidatus Limnocylindrales bacterium]|nr:LLM class flavin-dependent oxidoreductase [Candidatus Limnocylindrales bacterium]
MTQFDVSVGISPRQSFESWAKFVAELETEGVGRVWVIDSQLAMKDVYTGLVMAALNTRWLDLGTGVTNAVTRHPTITANTLAALAEVSHGRVALGLGAGDSALYGLGLKPQKVAEVEEAIDFFQAVFGGKEGALGGKRYRLPHVAATVPVYLAVSQERMCDLAGRKADGAIVMGPAQPDIVRRQVQWIERGLQAAGRAREDFDISLMTTMAPEVEDVRSWASTQARLLTHYKDLPPSLERFRTEIQGAADSYDYGEHLSTRAGHSAAVSDELTRALAVVGTKDECAARLRELWSAGVDTLMFPLAGRNRVERWRKIRDEVLAQIIV